MQPTDYSTRHQQYLAQADALRDRYNRLSIVRLVLFLVAAGAIAWAFGTLPWLGLLLTVAFLVGFSRFVGYHQGIKRQQEHVARLAEVNARELRYLAHDYAEYESGAAYLDPLHPYVPDLDVLGPYSIFQYINRAGTTIGRARLAAWLSAPVDVATIDARQAATRELAPRLEWRQHLQAHGLTAEDRPEHLDLLASWLAQPNFVANSRTYRILLWLILPWMLIGFTTLFFTHWVVFVGFLILPGLIIRQTLDRVTDTHERTAQVAGTLRHYAGLVALIDEATFEADWLRERQQHFRVAGSKSAAQELRRLDYLVRQLNVRYNPFAIILNLFTLWDLQQIYRLERWKNRHRDHLARWFDALADIEAMNSFATLHYNHPSWAFPELTEATELRAIGLGHPLLPAEGRVTNDLTMPTAGHLKLLTGSNMAGKSTFLRTVGINIVLACVGAPVCAERLRLPLLQVRTSMRTQDALHESTSSFFAELKRLKTIIDAVEAGENTFFLLDEILKGTNSNDRHTGSRALIRQLIQSGGGGIIATHDLELGDMATRAEGRVENVRMEVEVRDGELIFDYKLKPGVSQSFNATQLMRRMGIRIPDDA